MYHLRIRTTDGQDLAFTRKTKPRAWKSWLMQRCTYGTSFLGAEFTCKRVG